MSHRQAQSFKIIFGREIDMRLTDPQHPQHTATFADVKPLARDEGGRRAPSRRVILFVIGLWVFAFAGIVGVAVQRADVLPAGVPLIGMDSGVAACRAIAEHDPNGTGPDGTLPDGAFGGDVRAVFADSRYDEIRQPGVAFIDLATQLEGMGPDAGLEALPLVGPLTENYAALAGGCAEHGHTLPSLFGK